MAIDPSQGVIADLLLRIGRLESQVETLATSPRINRSSIDGGQLVVRDASGNDRITLGDLGSGAYGVRIADDDGSVVFEVTEDGWNIPYWVIPLAPNAGSINPGLGRFGTDQAAYTEIYRADFFAVGATIHYDFTQYPNAGNMDWRVLVYEQGGGVAQSAISYTGQTANTQRSGSFTLPPAGLVGGSGNVKGKFWTMRVEAKMNSGTRVDVSVNAHPWFAP